MERTIPPIGTRGIYSLNAPWTADPTILYSCAAIREFVDLENLGTDVFESYYAPMGIAWTDYEVDRRQHVVIITLISDTAAPIYVPSSYIAAFPDLSYRNYQHVVISASIGPLPDYIDLTFAQSQVANVLSDVVGMTPTVHVNVAAMTGVIGPDEHEALEAARGAAIQNRTTEYAKVLQLQQTNASLTQRLAILEGILRSNGLLPE